MTNESTCRHCGRYRKDHGKVNARCPNPSGLTWKHFEASEPTSPDFDGTDDYNERVMRDDANHRKHVARVLREDGS